MQWLISGYEVSIHSTGYGDYRVVDLANPEMTKARLYPVAAVKTT